MLADPQSWSFPSEYMGIYSPAIKNTADSSPHLEARPSPHPMHVNAFLKDDLKFANIITIAFLFFLFQKIPFDALNEII